VAERVVARIRFPLYVAALVVVMVAIVQRNFGSASDAYTDHIGTWVLLTSLFMATEYVALSFYDEKVRWGLSSGEAILLPMIMVLSPGQVVIGAAVAMAGARAKAWHSTPLKETFNSAQYGVAAGIAAGLWAGASDPGGDFTVRNAAVAAVAVVAFAAITHVFVALGFHLAGRGTFLEAVTSAAPELALNLGGNITLGLFFAAALMTSPWTIAIFPLPLAALYFGYRAVVGQGRDRERVERLHAASQALAGAPDLSNALAGFLKAVAGMASAQSARILLDTDEGYVWSGVESGETVATLQPIEEGPLVLLLEELRRDPTPLMLGSGKDASERLTASLIGSNLIGVPILVDEAPIGCLVVQGRVGADEFGAGEARLLEALANEVALAIESRRSFDARVEAQQENVSLTNQLHQAQKLETVGRLAGGIAHDFNNLLSVMLNYSRFVEDAVQDNPALRDDVGEIKAAAERAAALTRQLLIFSRREIPAAQIVDLNDVVRGIERLLRRSVGEDIAMQLQLGPGLGSVRIDTGQMDQVLLNLAINARDAMEGGGSIVIETVAVTIDGESAKKVIGLSPGAYVRLNVTDTGSGMTPAVRDRVFEPFFTTKPKEIGSGLGLATVYGIVQQSRGHISVQSRVGLGTTFSIHLPVTDEDATPVAQRDAAPQIGRGETVLVVEDQDAVRAVASRILTTNGYKVVEAKDGADALAAMETERDDPIRLLLSDVIMPKMSGLELGERVARSNPHLKVLFMSGYSEALRSNGADLDDGVVLLQKPFTQKELLAKVREVLDA
jgi:signal transduction histidine kinase/CheY-like chemotaxis protein